MYDGEWDAVDTAETPDELVETVGDTHDMDYEDWDNREAFDDAYERAKAEKAAAADRTREQLAADLSDDTYLGDGGTHELPGVEKTLNGRTVTVHAVPEGVSDDAAALVRDKVDEYADDGADVYAAEDLYSRLKLDGNAYSFDDREEMRGEHADVFGANANPAMNLVKLIAFGIPKLASADMAEEEDKRSLKQDPAYLAQYTDVLEQEQLAEPVERRQQWDDGSVLSVMAFEAPRYMAGELRHTATDDVHVLVRGDQYKSMLEAINEYNAVAPDAHLAAEGIGGEA